MTDELDAELRRSNAATRQTTGRLYVDPDPEWRDSAACRGAGVFDWFGPTGKGGPSMSAARADAYKRAKAVCTGCPVQTECLRYALVNRIDYGVYGGLDERQRMWVVGLLHIPVPDKPIPHGTVLGYQQHLSAGEPACGACMEASRAYTETAQQVRRAAS